MKKILMVAATALLLTGTAFAHEGKKCSKGKSGCSKKDCKKAAEANAKTTASLKKV